MLSPADGVPSTRSSNLCLELGCGRDDDDNNDDNDNVDDDDDDYNDGEGPLNLLFDLVSETVGDDTGLGS